YSAIQYQVDTQDLVLDVYEAYYQLIQAEKLLEVAEQSIRALEALRNQTREFFKAGVVPKVDVLSTEGQLAQARIQRTQSLTEVQRQKAQLNFLLRYPQETPIDVVQDINTGRMHTEYPKFTLQPQPTGLRYGKRIYQSSRPWHY